jgi:peptide deformylase
VAVLDVVTWENPRLRKKSLKVKRVDASIQRLIDDMIETCRANDGVGLAAPQVGVLLRIIVCEYTDDETEELNQLILINPEITAKEGEWLAEEGCLSIPGYWGTVPRAVAITVRGKDRHGHDVKLKTDTRMAHILQHEIDHLDGILYVDYLKSLDELEKVEEDKPRRRRRNRPVAGEGEVDEGAQPGPEAEDSEAGGVSAGGLSGARSRVKAQDCPSRGTPFCACGRRRGDATVDRNYV